MRCACFNWIESDACDRFPAELLGNRIATSISISVNASEREAEAAWWRRTLRLSEGSVEVSLESTDEQLIERIRGGEPPLFEVLMRRHNRTVYRAIRGILRNDDEIEDVMQDAYVRAYAHLAEFRGEARFSTWLTRIAVYEAFARVRRRKRVGDAPNDEDDIMEAIQPTPEQQASNRELATVLEHAIDALPESFRTVFVLRAVEEMSTAETAMVLAIPEDTVKTRLHRARGLLQKTLLDRADASTPEAFGFHLSRCDRVVDGVFARLGITRAAART